MMVNYKKAVLGTALAATVAAGLLAGAAPAEARPWGYDHHGDGAGIAVAAGLIGLAAGAAIASDRGPYVEQAPVGYYAPPPVAYAAPAGCYNAYPGYDGYCYPAAYYVNLGWGWHDGGWWYGGARYAHPFVVGGYRGGYGYRCGYAPAGYRGGYASGGYRGGYAATAYRGGYSAPAAHFGYAGGGGHAAYAGGGHAAYTGGGHGGGHGGGAGGGHGHR